MKQKNRSFYETSVFSCNLSLTKRSFSCIIVMLRGVAQLVARLLWEQNAAGSSPVTPTISSVLNESENTRYFFVYESLFLGQDRLLLFCFKMPPLDS